VTTLVATPYPELKAYAQLTPGVMNACVEFDPQTLRPTYRLSIGLPGRSNAFAIARRLGLDEAIARQAEEMVSQDSRQTEGLLADLHRLRLQAVQARDAAAASQSEARRVAQEARQQLAGVESERAQIMEEARQEAAAELERFRQEVQALRQELLAAEAQQEAIAAAEERLETLEEEVATPIEIEPPPPPVAPPPDRPIRRGDLVRIEPLHTQGRVTDITGEQTEVQVGTLRIRVGLAQLTLLGLPPEPVVEPAGLTYEAPHVSMRLDLRGCLAEDALEQLDHHLDAASLAGLPWVQIVHGKGTGALRRAVREFLRSHPFVASFRAGDEGEGGEGVTVATLLQA
jgi:DNA mismatch repair protein MutS2